MEKIKQQELKNVIDTKRKALVLDVRTLREYLDFGIKNIPFIPLELLDHIQHPEVKWNKSEPVYVISYTEARSKAFCHKLETLGYRSTFYVEEGEVEAWCGKHLSVVRTLKNDKNINESALLTANNTASKPVFNFEIPTNLCRAMGRSLRLIVGMAWFFEKMNCNIKFVFSKGFNYFENSTLEAFPEFSSSNYIDLKLEDVNFNDYFLWIPLEYACNVISKLKIKKEIQDEADQWARVNLKSDWIGVHYRGTDRTLPKYGKNYIEMDTYISYLKKVLDKQRSIFACSDQAQFIDQISEAFPGRVFSRNIQRSYDQQPLHLSKAYKGLQQRKDALIDILVLSKANLIYKTLGNFATPAFFFNPSVKIISLVSSGRRHQTYFPEDFVRIS